MKNSIYVTLLTFARTLLKVIDLVLSLFFIVTLKKKGEMDKR